MRTPITFFALVILLFLFQSLNAQSWEEQAIGILPNNYGVFDISVVDENIVWAVAFDRNTGSGIPLNHITKVLKTIDGGLTWESFDIEEAGGRISFDIEAIDANTAFITTQDYGNGSGRGVFKTEDGGETWVEKFNNIAGGVWIRFFNEQEAVVINRQFMATTQDGGDSWQMVSSGNIPSFQSDEFTILSSGNNSCQVIGNHVWFGTNKGRVYRSKDKGSSWEVFNTSLGNNALILSVAFKDSLRGIALNANTFNTSFAETNDGGGSWSNIASSPGISIGNIEYVPETDSVLIGMSDIYSSASNRVSVYSTDFGKTWETINTNIPFGGTEFIAANLGWTSRGIISSPNQPAMYKWQGDTFVSSYDVEAYNKNKVFPNPFTDYIFVESSKVLKEYRLSTINGEIIQSNKLDLHEARIDFQHLKLGMYVLELIFDDHSRMSKKIFKVN
ncbi:MAG: T9SS type A sorting domain-containing protein [Lewinellaceae bacterium]|nr:T9SS type A sorting domain-containing protein [Lewinellaceae bacterium]